MDAMDLRMELAHLTYHGDNGHKVKRLAAKLAKLTGLSVREVMKTAHADARNIEHN